METKIATEQYRNPHSEVFQKFFRINKKIPAKECLRCYSQVASCEKDPILDLFEIDLRNIAGYIFSKTLVSNCFHIFPRVPNSASK